MKNSITALIMLICLVIFSGCAQKESGEIIGEPYEIDGLEFIEREKNIYAERFAIDRYSDGYSLIRTQDEYSLLVIPEGKSVPEKLDKSIIPVEQPADNIYLAATSAMGLFAELDCEDRIKFSSLKAEDWYIEQAANAMNNGKMIYAGKYREPDYELLLSEKCRLSIQSTMIEHTPEVKEKLIELDIPVFIDRSSYEEHPLGRSEWIKVYGELCGEYDKASELFESQKAELDNIEKTEINKTAVFFYINSAGQAVTKKPGDYVTKMIELAGGKNVFDEKFGDDTAASSITIEPEQFCSIAKDADIIIYNSSIDGEIDSIDDLLEKYPMLADFKAVKNNDVWCTKENLFQETMKLGTVISDLNSVFCGNYEQNGPQFLFKLEKNGDEK